MLQSFERLAIEDPERPAAIADGEKISYGTLRRRARLVAAQLRAEGVVPDSVVAVGTSRSIEMLVGVLGAFYASCAYVPLDPDWPEGRKAFVVDDTEARALLTTTALADRFESSLPKVLVDAVEEVELGHDNAVPHPVRADQLAYVLYTSGSSGAPKGVAVTHRNLFHSTNSPIRALP